MAEESEGEDDEMALMRHISCVRRWLQGRVEELFGPTAAQGNGGKNGVISPWRMLASDPIFTVRVSSLLSADILLLTLAMTQFQEVEINELLSFH